MRRLAIVVLALTINFITGCGTDEIDGTSDESLRESIEDVKNSLPQEKRQEFEKAITTIAFDGVPLLQIAADTDGAKRRMKDRLNGMTADQIFAEADR